MTAEEKKMKAYVNAVSRRLNMPRPVKARVMNDFGTTIQGLREAGLSDGDIYDRLGTPKQAAANLNEQMKDYTYRKSPWRFAFLALAAVGLWKLLELLLPALVLSWMAPDAGSVGIIGGADGPTAIFVTSSPMPSLWSAAAVFAVLAAAGFLGYFLMKRRKRK